MSFSARLTPKIGRRGHANKTEVRLSRTSCNDPANDIVVRRISCLEMVLESDYRFAVGDRVQVFFPDGKSLSKIVWIDGRSACCRFGRPVAPAWIDEPLAANSDREEGGDVEASGLPESLGARILRLRKARRLSQSELAKQMNVSVPAVCRWEHDLAFPQASRLPLLAKALGVSSADLLEPANRRGLQARVALARAAIAEAAGTTADRVRISIDL